MNFRETTQADLDFVAEHSISRGVQKDQPQQTDYCYTLEHDGKVLIIGGFRLINSTTAWAWLDLTDASGGHIVTVYRVIREWADKFVKTHGIKRLQAYIECDFEEGKRLAQHSGFEKEFEKPMKNFVGNKDAFMYVRFI